MKWFEPIIIVCAILLVIIPIVVYFIKKKNGTLKCDCGHEVKECTGVCEECDCKDHKKVKLTYVLSVSGMKCGACESHINTIIRNQFDVLKVSSSRKNNSTTIISNKLLNIALIKEAISNAGYQVSNIRLD